MSIHEQPYERASVPVKNPVCAPTLDEHCVTCSDEALTATVLCVDSENNLALVQVEGTTREVEITLVTAVLPGDLLLVHGGVALSRL